MNVQKIIEQRARDAYARHQHNEQHYCLYCGTPIPEQEKELGLLGCLDCEETIHAELDAKSCVV